MLSLCEPFCTAYALLTQDVGAVEITGTVHLVSGEIAEILLVGLDTQTITLSGVRSEAHARNARELLLAARRRVGLQKVLSFAVQAYHPSAVVQTSYREPLSNPELVATAFKQVVKDLRAKLEQSR